MTLTDPFAAVAAELVVAEPPNQQPGFIPPAIASAVAPSEGKVVLTFKGGSAYDAPWIVFHANGLDEALSIVSTDALKLQDLMARSQQAGKFFVGAAPVNTSAAAAPNYQAPPPGATQAPGGDARQCQHGAMQFKSGVSAKNGKVWKAFFCPTPKGTPGQCEAEFLRD